jgi:hypothetical protein
MDVADYASYAGCRNGRSRGGLGFADDVAQHGVVGRRVDVVGIRDWVFVGLVAIPEGNIRLEAWGIMRL